MQKYFVGLLLGLLLTFLPVSVARAFVPGMHLLHPEEISGVVREFEPYRRQEEPIYVTLPFTLDDRNRLESWQSAFEVARDHNITPIVRLATRYNPELEAWEVPTRKDIIDLTNALNQLEWPQEERLVVLFNEPNHAKEWGGRIDPHEFAAVTNFALDWLGTEPQPYSLLPAALDLAASDSQTTKDAFGYWREALGSKPEILDKLYAWNSHSYPNPGFSSSPSRTGKNSLRGFEHELAFLERYSDRKWDVYITETGWDATARLEAKLEQYYLTAARSVWSNQQVKAVTPFLWTGSPGPFAGFSFFDQDGKPTAQWQAFSGALASLSQTLLTDRDATIPPLHQ